MAAHLDWIDEDDTELPLQSASVRTVLRLGELPSAVHAAIWRGDQLHTPTSKVVLTGVPDLDKELPGGGWPAHVLTNVTAWATRYDASMGGIALSDTFRWDIRT